MAYRAQVAQAVESTTGPASRAFYFMSNHELSGITDWFDLGDVETCSTSYKNEYEMEADDFKLTKSKILDLFNSQVSQIEGSLQSHQGAC